MTEGDFILSILSRPADEHLRLVYADWLEERGDPRAEFLRKESELTGVRQEVERMHREATLAELGKDGMAVYQRLFSLQEAEATLRQQLSNLRVPISARWLTWIDRTRIENCNIRFDFQCPVQWDQLALTDDVRVRHCGQCDRGVHFCASLAEAKDHASQGHCLAIASSISRTDGDVRCMEHMMDVGLVDMESVRKNMPPPREGLSDRRLPLPLIQRVRSEEALFSKGAYLPRKEP